ncbi:MAG: outer membrane porin, OprD family [Kiritimatiellales bacterium]|nr:outer membrane porin, OprD family [Kiritimatiellota bacterium]MBL7011599.1 outer membrane porin, OprD family [Kiritimatiellales bacterium]
MKKIILLILAAAATGFAADSLLDPVNDLGYGTLKLRAQTLSMYRDYENNTPGNAYSTTVGLRLGYTSPEVAGLSFGLVWDYVEPVDTDDTSNNGKTLLSNGRVNELNELWLKYNFGALGLSNTFVKVGRQVVNGEVFRADEFRQKPRSFESAILATKDIPDTVLTFGHAERLSNVWDNDSDWKFKDIEDVLGSTNETHGVTWAEAVYTGITNLEVAVFNAYAYDVVNVAGGRIKYTLSDSTAVNGYYRHENDVGKGAEHSADMVGASIQQKVGGVTLEPGFLSIGGDTLKFSEVGTGINHPLGSSMMIYTKQFNGGADTYYLKATTRIDDTILYALYNYTTHDTESFEGQELNFVAKQIVNDHFSVALKLGVGCIDGKGAVGDTTATDARLFMTYNF